MILDNDMRKQSYTTPLIEEVFGIQSLNFLVSFSGSANVGDWEDEGEEL